eukprot:TRINITY_DN7593_c0_g1_i1.p4 TRINITY_DN7593_c0_g1~~TRINITY_DN7593_c0_g1_i1.p4  ORF type:complete len:104 (-),score=5.83 TRINITY_DN7593_c0_g1_i1:55-366(-)
MYIRKQKEYKRTNALRNQGIEEGKRQERNEAQVYRYGRKHTKQRKEVYERTKRNKMKKVLQVNIMKRQKKVKGKKEMKHKFTDMGENTQNNVKKYTKELRGIK